MAFKIKESFQIGNKTVFDANANLSVLNAVIQSAAGKDTIELLGNNNSSANKLSITTAALTGNRTLTLPDKTGTVATLDDITSGATLTNPVTDNILATSATAATALWGNVTTGSIAIGAGLTTGGLNIATVGTGATPINIGHTNATIGITGNTSITGTLSATSINKLTITAPETSATLTIANGKTLTASNTLTFTGTDASSVAFGAGGTVAYTGGKLSQFASTTSADLADVISDETGTGTLVFATSPTLTTPVINSIGGAAVSTAATLWSNITTGSIGIGAGLTTGGLNIATVGTGATPINIGHTNAIIGITGNTSITGTLSATSINKLTITAPETSATLTIANGKTLTASNTLTFTGTDASSVAFGAGGTVAYTGNKLSKFASTTSAELAGVISDETGTGALVFGTSPTLTTPVINSISGAAVSTAATLWSNITTGSIGIGAGLTTGGLNIATVGTGATPINIGHTNAIIGITGNTSITGTLTVGGNLTVNGTTFTVNSTVVTIDDPIFTLGGNTAPVADDNKDRGIEYRWHNGTTAKIGFFGLDDSSGEFAFIPDATNASEVFSGTDGVIRGSQLKSTIASGTAPLLITSNTLVSNLNADLLDGQDGSYYLNFNNFSNVPSTYTPNVNNFGTIAVSGQSNVVADAASDTLTLVAGQVDTTSGITITTNDTSDTITIAHANTSSVSNLSSDNSSNTFVQDISFTFDTYGHVTAASVNTAAVSINDGTLTLGVSGNGLSGSQSFTANQSGNATFTVASNATANSTASTIVFRDANQDFAANIITVEGLNKDATVYSRYATATVATTNSTAIDTWAKATYRSCKYIVQMTQGTDYQVSELLVIHNGTAATTTEYAVIETNGTLGTLSVSVDATNVSLNVVMGAATSTAIKIDKTLIAI